jgi:hypothetical protein
MYLRTCRPTLSTAYMARVAEVQGLDVSSMSASISRGYRLADADKDGKLATQIYMPNSLSLFRSVSDKFGFRFERFENPQ